MASTLRSKPNMNNALSRIAQLDAQMHIDENTPIAPPDLFVPLGPRLGVSGSINVPPPLVPSKRALAEIAAAEKKKKQATPKKKKARKESEEEEEEEEEEDDEDSDSEESRGNSDYDDGDENDSSDSIDDMLVVSRSYGKPVLPVHGGGGGGTPLEPPIQRRKKNLPVSAPLDADTFNYETIMRRLLGKEKDDPLPKEAITWEGQYPEADLHECDLALTRTEMHGSTGNTSSQHIIRQLHTNAFSTAAFSDAYDKSIRAYYTVFGFGNHPEYDDLLQGNYKVAQ